MQLLAKLRVILTAAVTYIMIASAVVAAILAVLTEYIDNKYVSIAVGVLGGIATVLAAATAIIRRVTPVLPDDRGVLAQGE